jgi:carnitine 3-dehydrogenase
MTVVQPDQAYRVGIVGAGVIGGGWALHYLRTGFDVDVYDPSPDARADLLRLVEANWPLLDRMGLREGARPDRLAFHDRLADAVADADMVQENAPEDGPVKRRVLADVDHAAQPGVVIASSTSARYGETSPSSSRSTVIASGSPGAEAIEYDRSAL